MTHRTAALAIATLLISGVSVEVAQAQDSGEDRPARGGEGPRLSPRFERAERTADPQPAGEPAATNVIRQVPGQRGRTAGGPALPPDARVQEQRGGGRGGGGRAGGGSGGGDRAGGGGRGGTIIIDGSRDGQPRVTQRGPNGLPPRVIRSTGRGRVVVSRRIYPYAYGGFGLGYFYYDPFWNPWGPWGGIGGGWGGWGPWGGPWGYGGGYGYYGGGHQDNFGKVRLDVKGPKDAQVLVDGYYAGTLDDFDGAFQGLELESGTYRIEVESAGFEPLTFDTRVTDGRKITLHGALRRAEP
jgi:hypothetical protein